MSTFVSERAPQSAAMTADGVRAQPLLHGLWLTSRAPRPLDLFRVIVGLLLTDHFARAAVEQLPLLESGFLHEQVARSTLGRLGEAAWQLAFFGRVAVALLMALGVAPRASAVLLLIVSSLLRAPLAQLSHLDDWLAVVVCFWLALLPVGGSLQPLRPWKSRPAGPVSGIVTSLFLWHVLALYLGVSLWMKLSPMWQPHPVVMFVAYAVPALYLLPLRLAHRAAALVQVGLHLQLLAVSGEPLTHGLLLATVVLFLEESKVDRLQTRRRPMLDVSAVVALGYSLLLAMSLLSIALRSADLHHVTSRVLSDMGLRAPLLVAKAADVDVRFEVAGQAPGDWRDVHGLPDESALATRILLTQIAGSALSTSDGQRAFARDELRVLARHYCVNRVPSERLVTVAVASTHSAAAQARPLATFHCYDPEHSVQLLVDSQDPRRMHDRIPSPTHGVRLPHAR